MSGCRNPDTANTRIAHLNDFLNYLLKNNRPLAEKVTSFEIYCDEQSAERLGATIEIAKHLASIEGNHFGEISLLGILNGLLSALEADYFIAAVYRTTGGVGNDASITRHGVLTGFELIENKKIDQR